MLSWMLSHMLSSSSMAVRHRPNTQLAWICIWNLHIAATPATTDWRGGCEANGEDETGNGYGEERESQDSWGTWVTRPPDHGNKLWFGRGPRRQEAKLLLITIVSCSKARPLHGLVGTKRLLCYSPPLKKRKRKNTWYTTYAEFSPVHLLVVSIPWQPPQPKY